MPRRVNRSLSSVPAWEAIWPRSMPRAIRRYRSWSSWLRHFIFPQRWPDELGEEKTAAWKKSGRLEVFHYGEDRPATLAGNSSKTLESTIRNRHFNNLL